MSKYDLLSAAELHLRLDTSSSTDEADRFYKKLSAAVAFVISHIGPLSNHEKTYDISEDDDDDDYCGPTTYLPSDIVEAICCATEYYFDGNTDAKERAIELILPYRKSVFDDE